MPNEFSISDQASILKATAIVAPIIKNDDNESYDDDEDIRSGVNQPSYQMNNRPKTSVASFGPKKTEGYPEKELTPKERMLMNKLKRADEEAVKMSQMAKENYEERIIRETFRREATIYNSVKILFKKLT
jgi:hypothetical protein